MSFGLLGFAGCSDSDSASCGPFTPCGGEVVGSWEFKNICGTKQTAAGLPACPDATLDFSDATVRGSVIFNADMTYTRTSTPTGKTKLQYPQSCLNFGGVPLTCSQLDIIAKMRDPNVSCTGSNACTCSVPIPEETTTDSGTWSRVDTTLILNRQSGTADSLEYCVSGNELRIQAAGAGMMSMGTMGMDEAFFESLVLVKK